MIRKAFLLFLEKTNKSGAFSAEQALALRTEKETGDKLHIGYRREIVSVSDLRTEKETGDDYT